MKGTALNALGLQDPTGVLYPSDRHPEPPGPVFLEERRGEEGSTLGCPALSCDSSGFLCIPQSQCRSHTPGTQRWSGGHSGRLGMARLGPDQFCLGYACILRAWGALSRVASHSCTCGIPPCSQIAFLQGASLPPWWASLKPCAGSPCRSWTPAGPPC